MDKNTFVISVLNTILFFYSYFCIVAYSNDFIASCNIFIQFLMFNGNFLMIEFGMQAQIYTFKTIFKIILFSKNVGASCYSF